MSKEPEDIQQILKDNEEVESLQRKAHEINKDRINTQYDSLKQRKKEQDQLESLDLSQRDTAYIEKLQKENKEYLEKARESKIFLCNSFKGLVPYFPRNIILVTSYSGEGKSTTCANLAYKAALQGQRPLVISNEENASDVYNRITCLTKNIPYNNHESFSQELIDLFTKNIGILSQRITVLDNSFNGEAGQTRTIEGVRAIFNNIIENKAKYDVVILDYYQNVSSSKANPMLGIYQVQEMLANELDSFKNLPNMPPIILLAQMTPSESKSFKETIDGRKVIYDKATCIMSIKAEIDMLRSVWTVRKSRWNATVGKEIITGFKRGLYVDYDDAFKIEVETMKESKERLRIAQLNRIKPLNGGKNDA